jgi:hypothetical protein
MLAPDRTNACQHHIKGQQRPGQTIRKRTWPRQYDVTKPQQRLWTRYIAAGILRHSNFWRNTPILHKPPQEETTKITLSSITLFTPTFQPCRCGTAAYSPYTLNSVPTLTFGAFRSRKRLIIASDGSLLSTAGTFGWKLTSDKHHPLYQGSGPIDGPIDIGSSTRSELGGFTAPLLLITLLARHWGLRHRCKFRWLVDSKIAINRVTFVVSKDHRPTKQPENIDYLSVIRDLHKELRRPLKIQWIKGHQDNRSKYDTLPPDTQLNIDADHLATSFHTRPRSQPIPTTEQIDTTKVSITINNLRYASNIDGNLRFQINGGYLRRYLQSKHGWSNSTWSTINLPAFGRHLKTLPLPRLISNLYTTNNPSASTNTAWQQ